MANSAYLILISTDAKGNAIYLKRLIINLRFAHTDNELMANEGDANIISISFKKIRVPVDIKN